MKSILDIDLFKYRVFAYSSFINNFDIYVSTLGGDVLVDSGYEIFSIENGSIVAFEPWSVHGFHDCYFKQDNNISRVNLTEYETLKDVLEEKNIGNFYFYVFLNSKEVPESSVFHPGSRFKDEEINASTFKRCDYGKYGGALFEYGNTGYNIVNAFNVLNLSGFGHIARIDVQELGFKNLDDHSKYTASKTLSGMINLINDWATVSQPPFNNLEEIATCAKNFIQKMNIPQNVLQDCRNINDPSLLEYYLSGGQNIYHIPKEANEMPESLKNFILSSCGYKSLNSLAANHPASPVIPKTILDKEKEIFITSIIDICIKENLDINNIDLLSLKNKLKNYLISGESMYPPHEAVERMMFI